MNAMAIRRLILMAALCLAPLATRAATISEWVWFAESEPYIYSVNESNWIYINDNAVGEAVWFYNFGTASWTDEGPAGWTWFTWPYMYVSDGSVWAYIFAPPSGIWLFHYSDSSWEHLT